MRAQGGPGLDNGDSGLLWGRRHRRVRDRGTWTRGRAPVTKLGVRWRAGHGNSGARALAVKWLTAEEAQARMQGTGRLREYVLNVWRCMAPLPSFYKAIGQLNGLWESKGRRMPNFTTITKFLPDFNCKVK